MTDDNDVKIPPLSPSTKPTPPPSPVGEEVKEKLSKIGTKIEDKANAFMKSDRIRDPQNSNEFLTKNTIRLIEKTFWFLGIMLGLFVLVAIFRESIVELVLPLFTLVIGGILGFMSKDLLRNNDNKTG